MTRPLLCALACAALTSGASAATVWDEAVSGDLSNVGTSPTALVLGLGSNLISGTTGRSGQVDRDYFTFTLPAGWQLDTITLLEGSHSLGQASISFIGVQLGTQVTVNPNASSAEGLLGWHHYGVNDLGTDILPLIGLGFGASGFFGNLGPGSYAFWIQDTATGTATYRFDFNVSPVPEPAGAWLWAGGLAGLAGLRLARRR